METDMRLLKRMYNWNHSIVESIAVNAALSDTWMKPPSNLILPEHVIGIEFEVENWTSEADRALQSRFGEHTCICVADGSLRNNGMEIVTKPMMAKDAMAFAKTFFDLLPDNVDFSPRTSTHIHVNVRDFNTDQVTALVATYVCVERLLYKFVGNSRSKGIFCVPIIDSSLPSVMHNNTDLRVISNYWMKYSGLNLKPISKYGTVEFRHLGGTQDYTRLVDWLNLILGIVKFATENSLERVLERIYNLNSNSEYLLLLYDLYGPELASKLVGDSDYVKYMEEAVTFVKIELSSTHKFYSELMQNCSTNCALYRKVQATLIEDTKKVKLSTADYNPQGFVNLFQIENP